MYDRNENMLQYMLLLMYVYVLIQIDWTPENNYSNIFFLFTNHNRARISGLQFAIWYRILVISEWPFSLYLKIDLVDLCINESAYLKTYLTFEKRFINLCMC